VLGFLTRRVPGEAEELSQEVWFRVAKANPVCPDEASFRAYVYTVARRLIIDHHRRRMARIQLVHAEPEELERNPGSSNPESQSRANQILHVVEQTLSNMKPEIAEVFRLRMLTNHSFQQIATKQDVGLNTALGRMHRATKLIAQALADAGLGEGEAL
jgi:RNA polymerase sigma-70 factor (ECF subfamily)